MPYKLYLSTPVHEFEAILFSDIHVFRQITDDLTVSRIQAIRTAYPSPEFIDDSPDTAPSKRIKSLIPAYKKVADGIVLVERILRLPAGGVIPADGLRFF